MNVAAGVARGLQYLHEKGVAFRGLQSSDILLGDGNGDGYHPKLSQYGLAKIGQPLASSSSPFFPPSLPPCAAVPAVTAARRPHRRRVPAWSLLGPTRRPAGSGGGPASVPAWAGQWADRFGYPPGLEAGLAELKAGLPGLLIFPFGDKN